MLCGGDKGGNIINISSGASKYPLPNASLYSSTKAALDAFMHYQKNWELKTSASIRSCRVLRIQKMQQMRSYQGQRLRNNVYCQYVAGTQGQA